jgi:alpha-beta hydrolase superfamily lysophospholipase
VFVALSWRLSQARADRLRYEGNLLAGSAVTFLGAEEAIAGSADAITCPVLVAHSETDTVTSPSKSLAWFRSLAVADKSYVTLREGAHNLWWEPVELRRRLLEKLTSWLLHHTSRGASRAMAVGVERWPGGLGGFELPSEA